MEKILIKNTYTFNLLELKRLNTYTHKTIIIYYLNTYLN